MISFFPGAPPFIARLIFFLVVSLMGLPLRPRGLRPFSIPPGFLYALIAALTARSSLLSSSRPRSNIEHPISLDSRMVTQAGVRRRVRHMVKGEKSPGARRGSHGSPCPDPHTAADEVQSPSSLRRSTAPVAGVRGGTRGLGCASGCDKTHRRWLSLTVGRKAKTR